MDLRRAAAKEICEWGRKWARGRCSPCERSKEPVQALGAAVSYTGVLGTAAGWMRLSGGLSGHLY